MGINIGIGYEDSECAGCGDLRRQIIRVRVKEGSGLDDILEKERVVPIEKAMEAIRDWDDFAEMTGIEFIHIHKGTTIPEFKKELRMNEVYYMLNKALK